MTMEVVEQLIFLTLRKLIPSIYIWDQNYVITAPADGLAPSGARSSAGKVLTNWARCGFLQFSMAFDDSILAL